MGKPWIFFDVFHHESVSTKHKIRLFCHVLYRPEAAELTGNGRKAGTFRIHTIRTFSFALMCNFHDSNKQFCQINIVFGSESNVISNFASVLELAYCLSLFFFKMSKRRDL
jgi:hypothetical protein